MGGRIGLTGEEALTGFPPLSQDGHDAQNVMIWYPSAR